MAERLQNNAMYAIPDDPEHSTYRFIIVAAKGARQLQCGARPFLDHFQEAHRDFYGRSPPWAGEVLGCYLRKCDPLLALWPR